LITKQKDFSASQTQISCELAQARLVVYQLLSSGYCQSPDIDTVRKLLSNQMINLMMHLSTKKQTNNQVSEGLKLINEFVQQSLKLELNEVQTLLAVEYTKLLRGLKPGYGPQPPYESIYRSINKQPSQKILREIRSFYTQLGVSLTLKDQPDFIGLEFDLMRYLIEKEVEAWEKNQVDEAVRSLQTQWEFLNKHLACWVPEFCKIMYDHTCEKYYKGLALITIGYIADDLLQLKNELESAKFSF